MLRRMSVLEKIRPAHADKKRIAEKAEVKGVKLLWPDDDNDAYVKYCDPFSTMRYGAKDGKPERIECRNGSAAITVIGWFLKPYHRGLQTWTLSKLSQAPTGQPVEPGTPYIIELRLNQYL
jgi:hypothetical protein